LYPVSHCAVVVQCIKTFFITKKRLVVKSPYICEAKRVRVVKPGEEKTPETPYCSLSVLKGGF